MEVLKVQKNRSEKSEIAGKNRNGFYEYEKK